MSPAAAAEFQSPLSTKPLSSVQSRGVNPSSNPFSSTHDHSQNQSSSANSNYSSGFENANGFGFGMGVGLNNGNGSVLQSGTRVGSGRPRARLVKVRKHVGKWRTTASETETALGFNPFRSMGEDYGLMNNCNANSSFSNNGGMENSYEVINEGGVSNEFCIVNNENAGFVFGANGGNVGLDFNLETRESGSGCEGKMKSEHEHEQESGNDGNVRCQFVASRNDLCLNLNLGKEEFGETREKPASSKQFGISQNDLGSSSNIKKSECNWYADDSGLDFVFGASCCNSASNSNLERSDSIAKKGKTVSDDQSKMKAEGKTESQKAKATEARFNGDGSLSWNEDYGEFVFIFGGGNKESSCSDNCVTFNCPNEFKFNSKSFQSDNNIGKHENDNLDFDVNAKGNFVSKSTGSNIGNGSISDPFFKLPDVMKKLNINEYENDNDIDKIYDSNRNSCTSADTKFVFSSSVQPSSSSNGSSGPTDEPMSVPTAAVDGTGRHNFGNVGDDHVIFVNSCNIDNASFGSYSYKPSTDQAGLGKSSNAGLFSSCKVNSDPKANLAAELASLASGGVECQQNDNVSETPSMVRVQDKDEGSPTNLPKGLGASFTDFVTPNWDPLCFKASLYPEMNKKLEFSVKSRSIKDKRLKRTKGKSKQPSFMKKEMKQVHIPRQGSSQESPNSPECYSPMDFSPYVKTTTNDQPSGSGFTPSVSHSSVTIDVKDENFATAQNNGVNITNQNCSESNKESPWKGFVFGSDSSFKEEQLPGGSGAAFASALYVDGLNTGSHESVQYCFASGVEEHKYYTFSASSSAEGGLTSRKCRLQKKNRKKVGNKSFVISPNPNVKDSSSSVKFSNHSHSSVFNTISGHEENKYSSKGKVQNKFEAAEEVKKGSVSSAAAFQETCEMWRLRGNQSYKNGNLSKAEDFYTQGISFVPLSETAGCCIKPLVLCYSNRAATRITLGRMREALDDCMMAITVDPNFLKAYMRAANCHLVLGEVENAVQYYNKLLESGADVCLDRRIIIEAADGLQKAQKLAEWMNHSSKLLEQKTSEAASNALEIISEALSISSCSEKLLELKAEALYMLRKYEEAIILCEQTLGVAEKNFALVVTDNCLVNASGSVNYSLAKLWRWRLISKSYFCLGKLEMALDLLQKLEQVGSIRDQCGSEILESSIALAATIRELLHCKNAGNEAVRSGKYSEAVKHYTVALSSNVESRPFAAICFCNRAAALQALGQIADAIADCSLAMALDGNYIKPVSRRAVLHEMIRDYAQAASDLQRLVSILEIQSAEKAKQSGSPVRSTGSKDIRQARRHMSLMEEEAKNGAALDFYLILGVKASNTAADIKKAYRKAALKHHPDKAGQFLARTDGGDEGRLWKDIAHEVHKDADRLFKMIGEAYAVLSDTTKRSEYDLEEELRKAPKESHRSSHYRRSSDACNYSSRRSGNRQNCQDNWKTYGNSYSGW